MNSKIREKLTTICRKNTRGFLSRCAMCAAWEQVGVGAPVAWLRQNCPHSANSVKRLNVTQYSENCTVFSSTFVDIFSAVAP
jgi:hypothetical protein